MRQASTVSTTNINGLKSTTSIVAQTAAANKTAEQPKNDKPVAAVKWKIKHGMAGMCLGTCSCNICQISTDNMRRVGEIDVVRPFVEETNFRKFAQSTKTLENHIDMNNLDNKTKEVIRYY